MSLSILIDQSICKPTPSCNLCGGFDLLDLIDFGSHPVAKHYLAEQSGDQPTWPVKLFFCESCGLTQLVDSCPPEILYDNYVTLSSWKFQPHVQREIDLIKSLEGMGPDAKIIEIGSNDGMFLHQLSLNGYENTLGVEPAKDAYGLAVAQGVNTLQDFLSPELSRTIKAQYGLFDLFVSRQNLEHISDLRGVAESIGILVKPNGFVLIEVPNFACNLRSRDYGLWEEHVNYFTVDTLRHFLSLAGVELVHEETILFSGESICFIGRKSGKPHRSLDYVAALRRLNVEYSEHWPDFRRSLGEFLSAQKRAGRKIAVYGAGSRVFCLLNFAGVAASIDVIVDDQQEKQNKFMPGSRVPIPILPSDALYSQGIDICLLAVNTENEDKVVGKHAEWVRNGGTFWSVLPPSERLLPVWQINGESPSRG
ncbi:MAG: methyltransferase domain-containing protein [Sulfuritalea sp.]|nr:methyltransferase domain-containing protein [Sulfuritalea sp.]